jgi:hypothetical protein
MKQEIKDKIQQEAEVYLAWIKENRKFLSINAIEKEIGIYQKGLAIFVNGDRGLPVAWHEPVVKWAKKFLALSGSVAAQPTKPILKPLAAVKPKTVQPAKKTSAVNTNYLEQRRGLKSAKK